MKYADGSLVKHTDAIVRMLAVLRSLPPSDQIDALATVCRVFIDTTNFEITRIP